MYLRLRRRVHSFWIDDVLDDRQRVTRDVRTRHGFERNKRDVFVIQHHGCYAAAIFERHIRDIATFQQHRGVPAAAAAAV